MKTICCISLGRCYDRAETMVRQFATVGLEYRLLPAVDGRKPGIEEDWDIDFEAFEKANRRRILPGEVGCYASHLMAIEQVLSFEPDYGIVCEDDVTIIKPADEIAAIIKTGTMGLPDGWGIWYPGNPLMWTDHIYKGYDYEGCDSIQLHGERNQQHSKINEMKQLKRALLGTQCYIISLEFAQFMIDERRIINNPIDEIFRLECLMGKFSFWHSPASAWWCKPNFNVRSEIRP